MTLAAATAAIMLIGHGCLRASGSQRSCLIEVEEEIGADRIGPELPQHRDYLPAVICRMIDDVLQHVAERVLPMLTFDVLVAEAHFEAIIC